MAKTLIIAEKPSLAKNIVAAIGPMKFTRGKTQGTGYYENDQYVVSYAFGHMFQLYDAEDYDETYKKWDLDVLPICPDSFLYKISSSCKEQYSILKSIITSSNIDKIVNAGDSDREGEIIIRNILAQAKNKKPVYRLWMPDQTPKTIKNELIAMKPDSDYDNLANEGYTRTYVDWLYGISLTRLATLKAGPLLRIGRVKSPIISAICEREREIRNFVPDIYYVATHNKDGLKLSSSVKNKTKAECDKQCTEYNGIPLQVIDRSAQKKTMPRPKLFALSDLQGAAGKAYKLSPKTTLDVLQTLYEAGYTSYPRTNANYMAEAEKDKAKDIIAAIKKTFTGYAGIDFRDSKTIFDDSKIEAHSAITPTYKIPDVSKLSEAERKIYGLIVNRFAAVFCKEEYVVDRTTLKISNGKEDFSLNGDTVITPGYTVFESAKKAENNLPALKKGDVIDPAFDVTEKETTPPDHYTVDSLNKYLKNPFSQAEKKELSEDEETEDVISEVELGTEATRAGIIDEAIKGGYITIKDNRYGITGVGEKYVDIMTALGIDMAKGRTLELSKMLKKVYKNQLTTENVIKEAYADLKDICEKAIAADIKKEYVPASSGKNSGSFSKKVDVSEKEEMCKCPKCGGKIVETDAGFVCENDDCLILKKDKMFAAIGKTMNKEIALRLFTKGKVRLKGCVSAKKGTNFDTTLCAAFEKDSKFPKYSFAPFEEK